VTDFVVGPVEGLPEGSSKIIPVGRFGIGVFNTNGTYHALLNYCPHAGAPVCVGYVVGTTRWTGEGYDMLWEREGEILRCPWHGWEFEIESGRTLTEPVKRVKRYPVRVENGNVIVEVDNA
jgi:nitrite reductase (NADH) small subunit